MTYQNNDYHSSNYEHVSHSQLTEDARYALDGKWGKTAMTSFIYFLVNGSAAFSGLGSLLIGGPMALGWSQYSLKIARGQESVKTEDIFDGFKLFGQSLAVYLLRNLAIFVGTLFFIVPGIVIALGLSQTMFILADNPKISPVDALKESWEMTKGYKGELFLLYLRFVPYIILSAFTFFIALNWVIPYMSVTLANFYDSIKFDEPYSSEEDYDELEDFGSELIRPRNRGEERYY